jgi:acyl-CoA reductase-like NAD-dependent aldehyde dehydrogenase
MISHKVGAFAKRSFSKVIKVENPYTLEKVKECEYISNQELKERIEKARRAYKTRVYLDEKKALCENLASNLEKNLEEVAT